MDVNTFCNRVILLRSAYAFSVTSWFRTESRNAAVGGRATSKHLDGLAVDIVLDNQYNLPVLVIKADLLGLHAIVESDHIHIQPK